MSYDRFVDERLLTSRDTLNKYQLNMKIIDIDEGARDFSQRYGRRVLVKKTLLTIKHIVTEEIEERVKKAMAQIKPMTPAELPESPPGMYR